MELGIEVVGLVVVMALGVLAVWDLWNQD